MKENPEIVIPKLRPLRYSREGVPREKGVDVEQAIEALEWIISEKCDLAILFSHDSDLVPVVEAMVRLKGESCVETASRTSDVFYQRIRKRPPVYHHNVSKAVFDHGGSGGGPVFDE
ncbi:MAG TPA: NYN domain-containing protein, partial [Gaiellaceae bacterium]|nr:NYN domain-containing protein [Gaiellaceae bacterium]